jgi:aldose 1-epimerase
MLVTLINNNRMEVVISTLGGVVQKLTAPDRNGEYEDIVLGFDSADEYTKAHPYFGAIVGRYANRIAAGRFSLDGAEYELACNDGNNHLHGGIRGFDKVQWRESLVSDRSVTLKYLSADGEEGFPGNLGVTVSYALTDADELRIDYCATTDKPTPVNLTSHCYFNLAGPECASILEHQAQICANQFTPVNESLIPTGIIESVQGTAMDFREAIAIGERIDESAEQLLVADGYDHNWVLDKEPDVLALAATVFEPVSGRLLEVETTEPGIQFYTGNGLDGIRGKQGRVYARHTGFCLETQHYPDSPNQPDFPSTILRPGEVYSSTTVYRFSGK